MSKEQKAIDLDALLSQSTPQHQAAITPSYLPQPISKHNGFLLCPHCGSEYLHHEAVAFYAGGEDVAQRPVISLEAIGDSAPTEPKITLELRRAPDNPSYRRGAICTGYRCEGCHGRFRLVQSQHKGRTATYWEAA
jgi:hypothetical protein